ncbi:MAG: hypothetical protein BAJALOKI2v1_520014 [Promethearchaeota archaeon]|nr:MAG: hypothetical protein BAJALOKI2v1_520014 [Candidatus Lokiarchaeota archaeon]
MKSINLDLEKIESLISEADYETATERLIEIVENNSHKDVVYNSLNLLSLICDKSPSISLRVVKKVNKFINEPDSWIRLVSLEIFYQISMYRPNLLIEFIEKIRKRFYDQDASIRRLTVKIIGNLILSLHIDLDNLIEEYTERLLDNDWKVKLHVINTLKKLINQDYEKVRSLEPFFSMIILNLRNEDQDVARSAAELLKLFGSFYFSKENMLHILLNLLRNEKPRVKVLVIWLFGEIGKEKSSEIISFIPELINYLKKDDYRIQLKVIDALVNIAENNFDQIWSNLIRSLEESKPNHHDTLVNALYHLSKTYVNEIFPYLFRELESPSKSIRKGIALVFRRLYEECKTDIENEITKIIYKLESKYWRERKNTVNLLQKITRILKNRKVAIWITIELQKILKKEEDPDVLNEINETLSHVHKNFKNIKSAINKIKEEFSLIKETIANFQKIPAKFRKKLNSYIKDFKFNKTELKLNQKYNEILSKIRKFQNRIEQFEFKRLAFELIEEWEETKVQIIDELSIIKGFITEICEEKKREFKSNLRNEIGLLEDRINILKAQYNYIKENSFENTTKGQLSEYFLENEENVEKKFDYISQIRKNLFKLDVDIRELLINNVEFNEIFKDLINKWVSTKIEIQIYLDDLDKQIKDMKDRIIRKYSKEEISKFNYDLRKITSLDSELSLQLLQRHVQSVINQGIEGSKKMNNNFSNLKTKFENLIKRKEYNQAKILLEMNSNQVKTFIEETDKQIDNVIGKEKLFNQENDIFNLYVRPYIEKWNLAKESLIKGLRKFIKKNEEKLYLNQIKHYLTFMNPIEFELLSTYIGLEKDRLKEIIFGFIQENKLNAKTVDNLLYSQKIDTEIPDFSEINIFKTIKTISNKIYLHFRLNNPSNYIFKDLEISLKIPEYLKFLKYESFPRFIHLDELKVGHNFKFTYVLKIDKTKEMKKNLVDPSSDEIKLKLHYKDPFNKSKKVIQRLDLLLP